MCGEDTAESRSPGCSGRDLPNGFRAELAGVYSTRVPKAVPTLFPEFTWQGNGQAVHLTFDDGPHPEWTPFVLDELGRRGHKGTSRQRFDHESTRREKKGKRGERETGRRDYIAPLLWSLRALSLIHI